MYIQDLLIGAKFRVRNNLTVCTLTHKLGENGYENGTYPYRYTTHLGTEHQTYINHEVEPLPAVGNVTIEYSPVNKIYTKCIGYVIGILHNEQEWLLREDGELKKSDEEPLMFNTPQKAENYIKEVRNRFIEYFIYYRPYTMSTYEPIKN